VIKRNLKWSPHRWNFVWFISYSEWSETWRYFSTSL